MLHVAFNYRSMPAHACPCFTNACAWVSRQSFVFTLYSHTCRTLGVCCCAGTPEDQATYQMGSSLVLPLMLIAGAVILWTFNYFIR